MSGMWPPWGTPNLISASETSQVENVESEKRSLSGEKDIVHEKSERMLMPHCVHYSYMKDLPD